MGWEQEVVSWIFFSMDVTGSFFHKLRTLAVTLEKEAEQLKQTFHTHSTELEADPPMRYLHELYSEVRTLKVETDNTLGKSTSEKDATYDFLKACKVLMKRNATDFEKISDLFQKYGYKSFVGKETVIKDEAENNLEATMSDKQEPTPPACSEKSSLQFPQLSDFGLSKYAFPRTLGTMLLQSHAQKKEPRVDDSECFSPRAEHFHIHGRDLCLNDDTTSVMDDQTIFLLNNAKHIRQANKLSGPAMVLASRECLATPKQRNELCDYMSSPAKPVFCTPGLKISPRKNITLPKSPETNQSDLTDPTTETVLQDTESLTTEPEQICVKEVVPNKSQTESAVASINLSNKYLEGLEEPSPPPILDYRNILSTPPPPPEITVIPKQILQILSKYNPNVETSGSVEKMANRGIGTQFEKEPTFGVANKENGKYSG
ncbi:spindle and kinetochore-associated protein 3 isoform X2 [Hemicordylus capensis]|uniref:spindle and kinetochore-associated protein 3 isoform X2 n=1 Tax=Hemicordylus capensis TaxID=884348 RepID=UPI0023037392|nr:spindle and kinetochore-associated protein 3 isoform X2 [Hemicordylus capensis]